MKYIILSILLISSTGCKTSLVKKYHGENLCKIISELNENDQKHRGNELIVDPFFSILDSIRDSEGISNNMYGGFSKEKQLAYGRKARAIANKLPQINEQLIDSLMTLQENLDNKNTEILIDIIKKIGYPKMDSLPCKESPDLIFLHSQPQYFEEIKLLITKEYKKGSLNDFKYGMWLRHLGGRKENNLKKVIEEDEIIFNEIKK
ncbi:MAG: hypothetical protein L3J08_08700 [Flavobacteriaceae bacterium]|nr:hypothetical protein [Flavobacteriaceae bacterium]